MSFDVLDFKIVKIHRLSDGSRTKAFVDLGVNDAIIIKGLRIIDSKKGLFVSMPSEQGKNERWYDRVRCLNNEVKHRINQKVLEAYKSQGS